MRKLLITTYFITLSILSFGQSCLPSGFIFDTQSQVDSFRILYPGCTRIEGNLYFIIGSDISNLDSLDHIEIIEGDVEMWDYGYPVDSLDAFHSLRRINGDLEIRISPRSIKGFNNLNYIGGGLRFGGTAHLEAFNSLDTIVTYLDLDKLSLPDSFRFFPQLKFIGDAAILEYMEMDTIAGFDSLVYIGDDLHLRNFSVVNDITAFANLITIGGELKIDGVSEMETFDCFPKLISIAGGISITDCNVDSLKGFDQLTTLAGNLNINSNDSLLVIDAFHNLHTIGGKVSVESNALMQQMRGFDSLESVESHFVFGENEQLHLIGPFHDLDFIGGDIYIYENAQLKHIDFLPSLEVANFISISGNANLLQIQGLESLKSIRENFIIQNNPRLQDLSGFNSLRTVRNVFRILNNDSLINLSGIEIVDTIVNLYVEKNALLNDLTILPGMGFVGSFTLYDNPGIIHFPYVGAFKCFHFYIKNNSELRSITNPADVNWSVSLISENNIKLDSFNIALKQISTLGIGGSDKLTSLKGFENVTTAYGIYISDNDLLTSFNGLHNVQSLFNLSISKNDNLLSLAALSSLELIESQLSVTSNNLLVNFEGLENLRSTGSLVVENNPALNSFNGLENLEEINGNLTLQDNPKIKNFSGLENVKHTGFFIINSDSLQSFEGFEALERILNLHHRQVIDSNAIGCNSVPEVENLCLTNVHNLTIPSVELFPNPTDSEIFLIGETFIPSEATYTIYDHLGRIVKDDKLNGAIQVHELNRGLYTFILKNGDEIMQGRFVKM